MWKTMGPVHWPTETLMVRCPRGHLMVTSLRIWTITNQAPDCPACRAKGPEIRAHAKAMRNDDGMSEGGFE